MSKTFIRVEFTDLAGAKKTPKLKPESAFRLKSLGYARFKVSQAGVESRTEMQLRADLYLTRDSKTGEFHPVARIQAAQIRRLLDRRLRMKLDCERWGRWSQIRHINPRELFEPLLHNPLLAA